VVRRLTRLAQSLDLEAATEPVSRQMLDAPETASRHAVA
jgi:hypothetical protein